MRGSRFILLFLFTPNFDSDISPRDQFPLETKKEVSLLLLGYHRSQVLKENLEPLIVRQSKKVQKQTNKNDGEFQKDTTDKLKGSPMAKDETV
jgi:hypothetical protein